jgi:hypothetical protein
MLRILDLYMHAKIDYDEVNGETSTPLLTLHTLPAQRSKQAAEHPASSPHSIYFTG